MMAIHYGHTRRRPSGAVSTRVQRVRRRRGSRRGAPEMSIQSLLVILRAPTVRFISRDVHAQRLNQRLKG